MIRTTKLALAFLVAVGVAACSDSTGSDHDHAEAAGLEVVDHSTDAVLVRVNADRAVTGSLTVGAGAGRALEVYFLDDHGHRIELDDDHAELRWEIANTAIATLESHGDHLDLSGHAAGATTVVFRAWHGSHSDYDSPAIPLTVTP